MKHTLRALASLFCTFLISICLTPLSLSNAQITSFFGLSSYGTISYYTSGQAPTLTPSPPPSASPFIDVLWIQDVSILSVDPAELESHHINQVWINMGTFNGGSELQFWWGDTGNWEAGVAALHNRGIAVYAVQMNIPKHQNPINTDNFSLVTSICAAAKSFMQQHSYFDGWVDVSEAWTGASVQSFYNFETQLCNAIHSVSKKFVVCNQCWNEQTLALWAGNTGADYNSPMFYSTGPYDVGASWISSCFEVTYSPIIIGLCPKPTPYTQANSNAVEYSLTNNIDPFITNSNYAGLHLWGQGDASLRTAFMTPQDWAAWDMWLAS
jgi:hypothetical protein